MSEMYLTVLYENLASRKTKENVELTATIAGMVCINDVKPASRTS